MTRRVTVFSRRSTTKGTSTMKAFLGTFQRLLTKLLQLERRTSLQQAADFPRK